MATQQGAPSRPWFRLATMVRPPPPPPPPPTQQPDQAPPPPRPAFILPAFSQAPPPVPRPPNAAAPTSPTTRVSTPTSPPVAKATPKAARVSTPPTISKPQSPLVLPPPQPKYEEKAVITQETKGLGSGRHVGWGSRNPKDTTNASDSDDVGMKIITIAGENKGAIMDLGKKKDNPTPSSGDENKSGSNSEGKSNARKKNQKLKSPLMRAIMNSNVQGVNNSILLNSSTNHHDPGVHLSFSRKPSPTQ
ncbi:hypothetical protein HanRHA438_Chr03g0149991 [Helianthus annuus]|nr:hypothetical protein HanHA300_Chr03g0114891 [Helianthus annuus]KAJ0775870.1 hypothetical protein HanOQP8_Chr03g0127501 [Helianthus annuus]KAJ0938171.1 hypothetical protein HanRHA438_Chr03g0149991 [Helianthus annuus]